MCLERDRQHADALRAQQETGELRAQIRRTSEQSQADLASIRQDMTELHRVLAQFIAQVGQNRGPLGLSCHGVHKECGSILLRSTKSPEETRTSSRSLLSNLHSPQEIKPRQSSCLDSILMFMMSRADPTPCRLRQLSLSRRKTLLTMRMLPLRARMSEQQSLVSHRSPQDPREGKQRLLKSQQFPTHWASGPGNWLFVTKYQVHLVLLMKPSHGS